MDNQKPIQYNFKGHRAKPLKEGEYIIILNGTKIFPPLTFLELFKNPNFGTTSGYQNLVWKNTIPARKQIVANKDLKSFNKTISHSMSAGSPLNFQIVDWNDNPIVSDYFTPYYIVYENKLDDNSIEFEPVPALKIKSRKDINLSVKLDNSIVEVKRLFTFYLSQALHIDEVWKPLNTFYYLESYSICDSKKSEN